jgi:2-oxoacid:acceptor oxidoreductase delta subunit (pyruvate/2-ketoisovalerate family)
LHVEACISCMNCYFFCPDSAVIWGNDLDGDGKFEPKFDYNFCKGCGVCAHECPKDCIEMVDLGQEES